MHTEDAEETPAKVLAHLAQERRRAILATQREVAERAGVGLSTVQKLEYGTPPKERDVVRAIEAALGWERGSIDVALSGGRAPAETVEAAVLAAAYERYTREDSVLDTRQSDPSDSLDPAGEGPAGERLGGVQKMAVRKFIEDQKSALETQLLALDALAKALDESDDEQP
jgi:transcriptional regulator with XRE-family HTH domain